MGQFRTGNEGGFRGNRSGGRSGGSRGFGDRRSGGRSGFRSRDSGSFGRKRLEMHSVTCDKCGKQCEVPFKPSKDKPVYCSECFRKDGDSGQSSRSNSNSSGITQEQYAILNKKLDQILEILETIEFEDESDEDSKETDAEDEE